MWICLWNKRKNNNFIDCSWTFGFPCKTQHTGPKHFKQWASMKTTFWAHLAFETHSVIRAVTSRNSHCAMFLKYGLLMYTGSVIYFDRRISSVRPFWLVVDFDATIWSWKPKSKHRRNVSLSGKSGHTTAPAWSENINLASRELICAQMILKGRHSLRFVHKFASVFNDFLLR